MAPNVSVGETSREKRESAAETGFPACMSRNALLCHHGHHTNSKWCEAL